MKGKEGGVFPVAIIIIVSIIILSFDHQHFRNILSLPCFPDQEGDFVPLWSLFPLQQVSSFTRHHLQLPLHGVPAEAVFHDHLTQRSTALALQHWSHVEFSKIEAHVTESEVLQVRQSTNRVQRRLIDSNAIQGQGFQQRILLHQSLDRGTDVQVRVGSEGDVTQVDEGIKEGVKGLRVIIRETVDMRVQDVDPQVQACQSCQPLDRLRQEL